MTYPKGWYVAADASKLGQRPVKLRRFGLDLVLWRDGTGEPSCLRAACPHRGADLSAGNVRGGCLECPYHGFRFDSDGTCRLAPCEGATGRIPPRLRAETLPVREEHGLVWLWWGHDEPAGDPPWFPTLTSDASVVTVADVYPCHFTRFMENGLDVHHFAFVHHRILPFVGSQLEMKTADLDGDLIHAAGTLTPGPGERWRRVSDFAIDAYFPGLIHLDTLGLELLVAACPIDEETTWVAARYYRPRFGSGALARATSWLAVQADYQTAQRQDKRVLRSIRPPVGSPHTNMAVGADRAISLWYQRLAHAQQTRRAAEQRSVSA
jgi:phenylpropionate dioxygenase-like ring-hydroxylating dioxygenase large terminal subunit